MIVRQNPAKVVERSGEGRRRKGRQSQVVIFIFCVLYIAWRMVVLVPRALGTHFAVHDPWTSSDNWRVLGYNETLEFEHSRYRLYSGKALDSVVISNKLIVSNELYYLIIVPCQGYRIHAMVPQLKLPPYAPGIRSLEGRSASPPYHY